MSVARKTPKFAESSFSKTPLKQSRKSTSPSPSRLLHGSPFSNSGKGSRQSTKNSPYTKSTLKDSIEALRQIRDYNNSVLGSGSKDTRATINANKESEDIYDFERKHGTTDIPPPIRQHISKIEAFIASRVPKKREEDSVKPHNLAWRTASHDAQARLLKEGASQNQWPAANLLGKMGGLYNKFVDVTGNEGPAQESPLRKSGASISTRKSTKIDEDLSAVEQYRHNNKNKENQVSERRSTKEMTQTREGRLSHTNTSWTSKPADEYQSRSRNDLERLKIEANKTKCQMRGKIDFINSLYEELALQPREKPLLPSNRPTSPQALDSKETPRSMRLVDDGEIDASESNRRKRNEKLEREMNVENNKNTNIKMEKTIPCNKYTTFGDEIEDKRRLNSDQKLVVQDRTPSDLASTKKTGRSSVKSLKLGSEYEGIEGSTKAGGDREFLNFEENFKGGDTARRRENNRPPLPAKKLQEGDSRGFEQSEWAGDKGTPSRHSVSMFSQESKSTKNFIELNKMSSGVKSKRYTNYEKVLRNVEETCKPLLETLKRVSTKNERELSIRCISNRKRMWSPCSAVSSGKKERRTKNSSVAVSPIAMKDFPQFENGIEGFGSTGNSIKSFYEEMNNLTLKITEAAGVMQKTLDKLERYKAEDTERGGKSSRIREEKENPRELRYMDEIENEDEIY